MNPWIIVGIVLSAFGAGAAAGYATSDSEENAREDGYRKGQQDSKADYSKQIDKLKKKLAMALNKLKDNKDYFNAIYAMVAVAVAYANCDGEISIEEREQIEQFINGLSSTKLPDHVKEKIQSLYEKPLNLGEAYELAYRANLEMSIFDDIISLFMHDQGNIREDDEVFVEAWKQLRAA